LTVVLDPERARLLAGAFCDLAHRGDRELGTLHLDGVVAVGTGDVLGVKSGWAPLNHSFPGVDSFARRYLTLISEG
jgi:hypothetical protein